MKKIGLRTFIIISLVFHFILIAALVLVFLPPRRILRVVRTPISIRILTQGHDIDNAEDKSLDSIPSSVPNQTETQKTNEPRKMEMLRADDNEKTIKQIGHEEEKSTGKEYVKNKIRVTSESIAKEAETAKNNLAFRNADKGTNNARTAILSDNEEMDPRIDFGTNTQTQNIELAFPDYKLNPKPRYPMLARRKGYEGTILLRVFVLESGGVGKVELEKSSGYEILDESAFKAVKDWVFIPGKKDGEPIPSWVTVPIKFQLNSG